MKADEKIRSTASSWNQSPLEWPRAIGQADAFMDTLRTHQVRRRRRVAAAMGTALILTLAGVWWAGEGKREISAPQIAAGPQSVAGRVKVTAPERRLLADGSVVELQPGADIAVQFRGEEGGERRITLFKGEAHFQVARDPARPFVVMAGGVDFRAIGTAFSVGLSEMAVEMVVTEGRVAVESRGEAPHSVGSQAMVDAGQRVVVAPSVPGGGGMTPPAILPVAPEDARRLLAWRVARIEFNETPLREVVAEFNRLGTQRLRLAERSIEGIKVSGVLRVDNAEPLLQMLEQNYGVRRERGSDGIIVLHPAR